MSEFYEAARVTKVMKECLDALKVMYPKERNYEGILLSVLCEFEKIFEYKVPSKRIMSKVHLLNYNEDRKNTFGIGVPKLIDWNSRRIVVNDKVLYVGENDEENDGKNRGK